ncbi:MAG: hypothetical protein AAF600_04040 [Bacteroidota bacterium]
MTLLRNIFGKASKANHWFDKIMEWLKEDLCEEVFQELRTLLVKNESISQTRPIISVSENNQQRIRYDTFTTWEYPSVPDPLSLPIETLFNSD